MTEDSPENKHLFTTVFKTNGSPVTPGNQKLGWESSFCPMANKIYYNRSNTEGTFFGISWLLSEKFSFKYCYKVYAARLLTGGRQTELHFLDADSNTFFGQVLSHTVVWIFPDMLDAQACSRI